MSWNTAGASTVPINVPTGTCLFTGTFDTVWIDSYGLMTTNYYAPSKLCELVSAEDYTKFSGAYKTGRVEIPSATGHPKRNKNKHKIVRKSRKLRRMMS